ncbi:hypothetical protein [Lihuaxuella thermophila]|uniref:Uncharacterized protein n=1 Tax=Lihuaxuella thermophila TaxID=1173111 RepID=A0A1H8IHZ1_9BACL|nr:hypothetical protein [Lihuaxuella thermophila]SEN67477.1 hypothetical protein SAMN05444955_11772 [Lihuaxuella thermophila]
MADRMKLINQMANKIERELREAILIEPHPCYTKMELYCEVCLKTKSRLELRLVVPDEKRVVDDYMACHDCIKQQNIRVPDAERSLEFEVRTIAIIRIRRGK